MKSIDDLLETLRDLTYADKIHWEEDDATRNSYRTKLSKYRVRAYEWTDDDDGTTGVAVQLYAGDGFGNIIDSSAANQYSSKYPTIYDVYVAARRSAKNVSDTIEGIEEELKKLKKI